MRNSKQRNLVLDIINNSYSHPTAYNIYEIAKMSISNISLGTVYRNINYLENTNKIRRIKMPDNIDRYDRLYDMHSHFICINCNSIIDINKEFLKNYSSIMGNKVLECDIRFKGICKTCLKKEGK